MDRMHSSTRWRFAFWVVALFLALALISCDDGGSDGGEGDEAKEESTPNYPSSYSNAKIIFVTSTIDTGNLSEWMTECSGVSGLEAADCICQQHAEKWGNLSGTYKAWLSDSKTNASARLSHSDLPYVNRKGKPIAANWTELTGGALQCNDIMNYDETGEYAPKQFNLVWTGTDGSGMKHSYLKFCNDWTSGDVWWGGMCGSTMAPESNFGGCWTEWGWRDCDDWNRLYCVEQ